MVLLLTPSRYCDKSRLMNQSMLVTDPDIISCIKQIEQRAFDEPATRAAYNKWVGARVCVCMYIINYKWNGSIYTLR